MISDLNRHIALVHKEKQQFKCKICTASFDLKKDLNEHIESVHKGKQQLKFKICHITFTLKIDLNQHIFLKVATKIYVNFVSLPTIRI